MLQTIRDNAQGIVIWVIVGLIILAFATFGLNAYLGGSVKDSVVTVNGQEIPRNVYQRAYQNTLRELQSRLGEQFRPELFDENMLRDSVIQRLVNERLFSQFLDEAGFAASDQLVYQRLHEIRLFEDEAGQFSPALYNEFLQQRRITATQFEQSLGSEIIADQFRAGLEDTAFVTEDYLNQYYRLLTQTRDVGVLTLSVAAYEPETISEQAIEAYYQDNASAFMTPPQVKVNYIELSIDSVAKRFDFTEQELKNYYETHQGEFESVDHAAARQTLRDIRQRLQAGGDFAELAKQYSQDAGSAAQGGDLGYIAPGIMEQSFDEAIRRLEKGEVSEIIKTSSGYHLAEVVDIKEQDGVETRRVRHILIEPQSRIKAFEQVRDEIRQQLQREQAENIYFEEANQLSNIAYEQPGSLQPAADQLGLQVQQSDFYSSATAQGVLAHPDAKEAAFSERNINEGRNSDPIEISDTHMLILRVVEHKAAQQKPLEEVKPVIRKQLRAQQAREAALAAAREAQQKLAGGESPQSVASAMAGASWQRLGYIGRQPKYDAAQLETPVSRQLRDSVFALSRASNDGPQLHTEQRPNGDAAVVVLYDVKAGEGQLPEAEQATQRRQLLQARVSDEQAALLRYMRETGKVEIHLTEDEQ